MTHEQLRQLVWAIGLAACRKNEDPHSGADFFLEDFDKRWPAPPMPIPMPPKE